MIVMCANNSGAKFRELHARFPGKVGWLIGPGGYRTPPEGLPHALDNARYAHFLRLMVDPEAHWDEASFYALVARAPCASWVAVPDVVADRERTLADWDIHAPRLASMGRTLAFVVQDGMTPSDVPPEAAVVFVGGTKEWKWRTLTTWTRAFSRVHLGKCNTRRLLKLARYAGCESVDGTGWFRGNQQQLAGLIRFLEEEERIHDPVALWRSPPKEKDPPATEAADGCVSSPGSSEDSLLA